MVSNRNGKYVLIGLASVGLIALLTSKVKFIKPVLARVTGKFGKRIHPVTKKEHFHNGIDVAIPEGTEIKSPADGIVLKVFENNIGGKQIVVKHDNGFTTGYAHLSKHEVKIGDKVKQGDTLALSGNTGRSTGAHLHFTLRDPSGNFIDPEQLIFKA